MGNTTQHHVTRGFQCKAIWDMRTGRADGSLGTEVRSYGERGPSLDAMAEALRGDFADVRVRGHYIEVLADGSAT